MKKTQIIENTFAAACYDQNTFEELLDALLKPADKTDCKIWRITSTQYKCSLVEALKAKINNYVDITSRGNRRG